jgi:signal peptidase I
VLDEPWLGDQELDSTLAPGLRCGSGDVGPTTMGENEVFLIGDNRPMSFDSRMFGPVDIDLIVGRAVVVIWPPSSVSSL